MKQFFRIFLLITSVTLFSDTVYFMPNDSKIALKDLTSSIKKSKYSIKAAIYSFTHRKITKALKKASKKGVTVQIIYDEESNIRNKRSSLSHLALFKAIKIRTLKGIRAKKGYYGKMHSKFMIIDNKILFFGSANWSHSAFGKNYEILYKTTDQKLIKKFLAEYKKLIKKSKKLNF